MAYTVTTEMPLNMPTPGTREPAAISLLNQNCVVLSPHDHTTGKGVGVGRMRSGLQANRPAFGSAGNVYFATDTGRFYADTGTAWVGFITEGGQATVTGWTLIDPVIRDTLQFGPEGSATIDAALTRPGPNQLRTDNNVGVGVTPAAWGSSWRVIQIGATGRGALWDDGSSATYLQNNGYHDGTIWRAVQNAPSSVVQLNGGGFAVNSAPAVAAGAEQTFTTRLQVTPSGVVTINTPDPGNPALRCEGQGVFNSDMGGGLPIIIDSPASSQNHVLWRKSPGAGNWSVGQWAGAQSEFRIMAVSGSDYGGAHLCTYWSWDYGTMFLNPRAGGHALSVGGVITSHGVGLGLRSVGGGNASIYAGGVGSYFHPDPDNGVYLGHPGIRWAQAYITNGVTTGSAASLKDDRGLLDPEEALAEVLRVPVHRFVYKRTLPDFEAIESDELRERAKTMEAENAKYVDYERVGFMAEDAHHPDGDDHDCLLLAGPDSVEPSNTAGVLMAAMQASVKEYREQIADLRARIAALEDASGQAPAA